LFSRRTGDPNVQNVTTTTMTAEASRWGNAGTKLLLASGVAGTIAWCGVLTYAILALVL